VYPAVLLRKRISADINLLLSVILFIIDQNYDKTDINITK
jgi:hypothetical protein